MSGRVRALPPAVSSRVRSGHSIETLSQCVLELVQNALGAGATSLVVRADMAAWRVQVSPQTSWHTLGQLLQVSDNGGGVTREEMVLVGERYATSRAASSRGEALASIVQVARTVRFISRHRLSRQTCCKVFQGGRGSLVPGEELAHAGTVVKVYDLFYNLPVRRRVAATSLELAELRNTLRRSLLVLPEVSLSLHDDQSSCILLQVAKATSLLARHHQLLGCKPVQQIEVDQGQVKITALFDPERCSRSELQLIFVNKRLCEWQSMYTLVRRLLQPALSRSKQLLYIISIEDDEWVEFCPAPSVNLDQEKRVAAALSYLVSTFLTRNNISPLPQWRVSSQKLSSFRHHLPTPSTSKHSHTHTPQSHQPHQPHQPPPSPGHWKVAVDPTSSKQLQIHPLSGSCRRPHPLSGSSRRPHPYRVESSPFNLRSLPHCSGATVRSLPAPASRPAPSLSGWVNPTFSAGEQAVLSVSRTTAQTPCKFSKDSLKHTRVLGQVASKFIACIMGGRESNSPHLLVAVDQHAAHERVRLEAFLRELYDEGERVKMTPLHPPLPLSLSDSQQRVARSFPGRLAAIGVQLQWCGGEPTAISLPSLLANREDRCTLLQEMVRSYLEELAGTRGGAAGLPSALADLLHSLACHGAIRFGDHLDKSECCKLVQSLASCSLPFQCAHGRPSLAPLIDLRALDKRCPPLTTPFPSLHRLTATINK